MRQRVNTQAKLVHIVGWGNGHNTLKLKFMPSEARLKNFEIKKPHTFCIYDHSQNIFPVFPTFSLCYSKIPCVFPVWKK